MKIFLILIFTAICSFAELSPEEAYRQFTERYNKDSAEYQANMDRKKNFKQAEIGQSGRNWLRDLGAAVAGEIISGALEENGDTEKKQTLQKTMWQEKEGSSQKEEFCKQEESKLVELQSFMNENLAFEHIATKDELENKWHSIDVTLDTFYRMLQNINPDWEGCQFKRFSRGEAELGLISIRPNGYFAAMVQGECLGEHFTPLKDAKRTKKNLKNYLYQKIKNRYANVPTAAELKKIEDKQREIEKQAELEEKEKLKEAARIAKDKRLQEELEIAKEKQQKEIQQKKTSACISACSSKQGVAKNICINDCKRLNR